MGKKGSGGKGSGRGAGGRTAPPQFHASQHRSAQQMGRFKRDNANAQKQLVTDAMQHALRHGISDHAPAPKKGPSVKRLGTADSHLIKAAKSAKRPSKAQRELQNAAAVRKTISRLHRKAARG
jgi:hypothetical protein